ncbi:MAG: CHRD domain-containing protein [Acidimicrobiia bacterium]|nr:CHRD domain-containing protein [Acidimicrobiia bacterium]
MKKLGFLLLTLTVAGWSQTAETRVFRAILSPANEVPPITGLNASGTATVWAHVIRNAAGQIVSGSVDFHVNYSFPGEVSFTGLHIHNGPAGVNAGVTINSGILGASPIVDSTGRGRIERQGQVLVNNQAGLDTLNGMFRDPSQFYVNLHTTVNTAGAIRGQLVAAESVVVMGMMSPANEVPPIQGLNASGVGTVVGVVTRGDDGAITSGEVVFDVNYSFPAQVTFTGLHVHSGPAGVNAGVTLNSALARTTSAENGRGRVNIAAEIALNAASIDALEGLFRNPASYYINLHTTDNTGGAIRSQLRPTDMTRLTVNQTPANEVPPIAGLDASAASAVQVHTLRNEDGSVLAAHVVFDVNHRFPGETEFTGLHVHNGVAGENGPVRIDSGIAAGSTITSATGFGNIFLRTTVSDDAGLATVNSMLANPERHYLNLHTAVNRGGAVRAQTGTALGRPVLGAAVAATNDPAGTTGAPGGLVSIYGINLASVAAGLSAWQGAVIPSSLNGVSVTVGGRPAPLLFVSSGQINLQVPLDVVSGMRPIVVTAGGQASAPFNMQIAANAPSIFFHPGGGIVVKNADFSLVTADNAASAGEILVIYMTGMGQTAPPIFTGRLVGPATPLPVTAQPAVTIGGATAEVIYSIASPGFVGLNQVAVRMPAGIAAGTAPVIVRIGPAVSNTVNIAVR